MENIDDNKAKNVEVLELYSPGCHACKMFEEFWGTIEGDWPNVKVQKFNIIEPEGQELVQKYQLFATPGIVINGELWSTGGVNKDEFIAKLKELS